jgi:hypothetical protein
MYSPRYRFFSLYSNVSFVDPIYNSYSTSASEDSCFEIWARNSFIVIDACHVNQRSFNVREFVQVWFGCKLSLGGRSRDPLDIISATTTSRCSIKTD